MRMGVHYGDSERKSRGHRCNNIPYDPEEEQRTYNHLGKTGIQRDGCILTLLRLTEQQMCRKENKNSSREQYKHSEQRLDVKDFLKGKP